MLLSLGWGGGGGAGGGVEGERAGDGGDRDDDGRADVIEGCQRRRGGARGGRGEGRGLPDARARARALDPFAQQAPPQRRAIHGPE